MKFIGFELCIEDVDFDIDDDTDTKANTGTKALEGG